ncbi:NUDIX hydrolase [Fulvivirga sp. RKSG066]|uniref:NUDIX domain-containing protein n=1 Tax=Fulvivirga aurantia TaxID=2529383 RepID=UPI0012BC1484|nr:NUDIX hydrolase [Fulvivirga aurantia]MTI21004.1 NUDIX hydrolase [Fulvivirga aurantia]
MAKDQKILVTVDAVVFDVSENKRTHLLLIQRKNDPYKDQWAFPGGFVEEDEDLPVACARELEEETGLSVNPKNLTQIGAFGKPGRDPRGRTITVAFHTEVDKNEQQVKGADDAAAAKWWPLNDLPNMAFDHEEILNTVL